MENIIELLEKVLFEITDSESIELYKQLIYTHPDYNIIKDLEFCRSINLNDFLKNYISENKYVKSRYGIVYRAFLHVKYIYEHLK